MTPVHPKRIPNKQSRLLRSILIILALVITMIVLTMIKNSRQAEAVVIPTENANAVHESAESKLDRLLEEGKPVFLFIHSNNCQLCIDMIAIVNEVYPQYDEDIAIVDVDVYNPENQNLLRRAQITSIPTQIFIDADGSGKGVLGLMSSEQLDDELSLLAESVQ
jgi:thiol:disulfide interchange protein